MSRILPILKPSYKSHNPSRDSTWAGHIHASSPSPLFICATWQMIPLAGSSSSWKMSVGVTLTPLPNGASGWCTKWAQWKQSPSRKAHFALLALFFVLTRAAKFPGRCPRTSTIQKLPSSKKSRHFLNGPSVCHFLALHLEVLILLKATLESWISNTAIKSAICHFRPALFCPFQCFFPAQDLGVWEILFRRKHMVPMGMTMSNTYLVTQLFRSLMNDEAYLASRYLTSLGSTSSMLTSSTGLLIPATTLKTTC